MTTDEVEQTIAEHFGLDTKQITRWRAGVRSLIAYDGYSAEQLRAVLEEAIEQIPPEAVPPRWTSEEWEIYDETTRKRNEA